MTTRLYRRECGWHPEYRRKRAALRAAARHQCAGTPVAETRPPWWSRLWTNLWASQSGVTAVDTEARADDRTGDDVLVDARGKPHPVGRARRAPRRDNAPRPRRDGRPSTTVAMCDLWRRVVTVDAFGTW
ncbi:hypothetical protein GCM10017788_79970 [Amycolatopsis acidiphila]|nr:hypothetical protein GCM10017788_79970 [Amycolatopsis acidiphila]